MILNVLKNTVLLFVFLLISCGYNSDQKNESVKKTNEPNIIINKDNVPILVGANQTNTYLPLLKGKRVAVVANQTSVIFQSLELNNQEPIAFTHLVDSLVSLNIDVKKVFAPEHGFRGTADAGEVVKDGVDTRTGLPIVSLYGNNKKPTAEQLKGLDMVIFDIQDVGARFYTYISSLHYVMEACAEQGIPMLILDRPNPNGHYVDGPILEKEHKSFVGMHPIPIVHGMTIGEYAQMINGEKWLTNGVQCDITVIKNKDYWHKRAYNLPIKPSPNLPNNIAINLYPSLCFFEGTNVSAGRGTDRQFQIFGSPYLDSQLFDYTFTPHPNEGSKYPKHKDEICYGLNLNSVSYLNTTNFEWLIKAYNNTEDKTKFFNAFFTKLAGTTKLQKQIENGLTQAQIKATWQDGLQVFNTTRAKYLLYD